MKRKNKSILNPTIWLILSLTLGLAPFYPEPHVWEKLKWILAGANGMQAIDWFDFILHGLPWILLIISIFNSYVFVKKSS